VADSLLMASLNPYFEVGVFVCGSQNADRLAVPTKTVQSPGSGAGDAIHWFKVFRLQGPPPCWLAVNIGKRVIGLYVLPIDVVVANYKE